MNSVQAIIKHIAPNLASALKGPFSGVATQYMLKHLDTDNNLQNTPAEQFLSDLLNEPANLKLIKSIDIEFAEEMKTLNVDTFSIENDVMHHKSAHNHSTQTPQIILSSIFLIAYFLMLAAIFVVEVSDSMNMEKGENSLMGELQILFGVLTAGVGQILSFWFGGAFGKRESSSSNNAGED